MIMETLKKIRSHRSFTKKKISMEELEEMVESTRYASSTRNAQKLRYVLINDDELCKKIFPLVNINLIKYNDVCCEIITKKEVTI